MKTTPCHICGTIEYHYLMSCHNNSIVECYGCGLIQKVHTQEVPLSKFNMSEFAQEPKDSQTEQAEQDFAIRICQHAFQRGLRYGNILCIAQSPMPYLEQEFAIRGFSYTHVDNFSNVNLQDNHFNCIVLPYSLSKYDHPAAILDFCNNALKPEGILILATQSIDSKCASVLCKQWDGWQANNFYYFNSKTVQLLLEKQGFSKIVFAKDKRLHSLNHLAAHAHVHTLFILKFLSYMAQRLPSSLSNPSLFRKSTSGLIASAIKTVKHSQAKLSIIMPVYNEKISFANTLKNILTKKINGIYHREIIIVESNSTDGTRELVQSFEWHPEVKVIYEDKPRGKGYAVRSGLQCATGDIVLIQDADAEYDVNDYDELLSPLLENRELFVLGTRHNASRKMRTFTDQPLIAAVMNTGQIFFTTLLNVLYGACMTDPFTMYKVIRKECLYGLNFECNRFDFDHELVIKLLLKGYKPFEVPVNYQSRSYNEGKKVTFVLDPLLWIKANLKFRFTSPYTKEYKSVIRAVRQPQSISKVNMGMTMASHTPLVRQEK